MRTLFGKIMRRVLKKLFMGEDLGNLLTLANPESVEKIKKEIRKSQAGFIIFLLNFLFVAVGITAIIIGLIGGSDILSQIPKIFQR